MINSLPLVVLAGFLGSFHCTAMCGPFVSFYSIDARKPMANHLTYQTGRLCSYLALGTLAGTLGQSVLYLGSVVQAQRALIVVMGVTMIAAGILYLVPLKRFRISSKLHHRIGSVMREVTGRRGSPATAGLIGLCSTLLPCGFLYAFILTAVATGHPLSGLIVMFGFWLGTLPSLMLIGTVTRYCSKVVLARAQKLVPILLIVFGILAINGKWSVIPGMQDGETLCHGQPVQTTIDP